MSTATVLGFAYESPVMDFPARTGPGTTFARTAFTVRKGTSGLRVLDIQPDAQGERSDLGRVYQWLNLQLPDGSTCWMRGHVIGIQGDFNAYGYGTVNQLTHEYLLARDMSKAVSPAKATAEIGQVKPETAPSAESAKVTQTTPAVTKPSAQSEISAAPPKPSAQSEISAEKPAPIGPGIKATGPATAYAKTQQGANTRRGPSTGFDRGVVLPRLARVPILEVRRESQGQNYRWFRVSYEGQTSWVREDLVGYDGDTETLGLPQDLYPNPMGDNCWWVRGYNLAPHKDPGLVDHDGWDLGAATGEPIYSGPNGGTVVRVFDCSKCTPDKPSTLSQGLKLGASSVFSDPGWGYGYGNFVIVRYTHSQLPISTRDLLTTRGFPGGCLFVMYAHLNKRHVSDNQVLGGSTLIGACGNTGNSEATHLHLEVRASKTDSFTSWAGLRGGVMDPVALFKR